MQPFSTAELLKVLLEYDSWLKELGIAPQQADRLHTVIRFMEEAEITRLQCPKTGPLPVIGDLQSYLYNMASAMEFFQIYRAFRNEACEAIAPKLIRAIKGPFSIQDESVNSSDARNTMFELALAAECGCVVRTFASGNRT